MPEIKTTSLYKGTIKIEFKQSSHRYKINGKAGTPSVTSITGQLNKPALMYWAVNLTRDFLLNKLKAGEKINADLIVEASKQHTIKKEQSATTGTMVHEWCQQFILNQIEGKQMPEMPEDDQVINGVNAFLDWVKTEKVKFVATELLVYSKKYKFVGTMDCKFTLGREKHKIMHAGDFKTSSGIYNEMLYQVSAYQGADEEESKQKYGSKWIIRFDKNDGEFEAKEFPAEDHKKDYSAFLGLLAVKKREMELK